MTFNTVSGRRVDTPEAKGHLVNQNAERRPSSRVTRRTPSFCTRVMLGGLRSAFWAIMGGPEAGGSQHE
jgi:hypothetical protein